jgi:hypothetical protein
MSFTTQDSASVPDPRYPIGPFKRPAPGEPFPAGSLDYAIASIAELPEQLRNAVDGLDSDQIDTPYRDGGWTLRQLVHHIADSHANAFIRLRKALTEVWPTVEGYSEQGFAELSDSRSAPVEWSLELIESLHARWVMLLQTMSPEQFQRGFNHSEHGRMTLEFATNLYGWHSRHHLAHITHLRAERGW